MVKFSNGESFFGTHISVDDEMLKWWKKSIIQWIVWLDSTVVWVIKYVSVYLIFYQDANDGHPDEYGGDHLFYLWCLLVYILLWRATYTFFLMVKWCNGEMVSGGAVMMVRLFCRGDSIRALELILSLEWIFFPVQFSCAKIVVGENFIFLRGNPRGWSWEFFFPGTTIDNTWRTNGTEIVPGNVLGWAGTSVLTMIQILLVRTQNYAYVMLCSSTFFFSTYRELVPTYPFGHGPRAELSFPDLISFNFLHTGFNVVMSSRLVKVLWADCTKTKFAMAYA